ncbi:aprataxin and PNK-like factor [Ischnura elegans]|uniref:aprataxin and PNK-like factor n=1 Tax=Ischnura elegans TaxID=197161 RepID=UPI001ED8B887|nr:aprataxin and PNK-like factor [Ischnura elegans]
MESHSSEGDATAENTVSPSSLDVGDSINLEDNLSGASGPDSAPRQRCKYGADCYRRNDDHKKLFSHPGDPDYNKVVTLTVTPDTSDNRPECKYGTNCYRKNPQHKKDFKHTSTPSVPVKRKRKKKVEKAVESDQESSDDYDYDDPFLNDDSSDDYQPTSSDSDSSPSDVEDMEEDMKRTLRDGKKFVRK